MQKKYIHNYTQAIPVCGTGESELGEMIMKENMFKQIEWLFFDVGTTLVDESKAKEHRIWDAIEGTDISYDQVYTQAIQLAKQGDAESLKSVLKSLGLSITPWHREDEVVYPHAVGCLARLHGKYKIGVIANQSLGTEDRMSQYGLSPYLDLVIASAEEGIAKPDLRIFELALERANCLPENAVMIGDRLDNDIRPAKRTGLKTIWIRQGFGGMAVPSAEEETPDYAVNDLRELLELLV